MTATQIVTQIASVLSHKTANGKYHGGRDNLLRLSHFGMIIFLLSAGGIVNFINMFDEWKYWLISILTIIFLMELQFSSISIYSFNFLSGHNLMLGLHITNKFQLWSLHWRTHQVFIIIWEIKPMKVHTLMTRIKIQSN